MSHYPVMVCLPGDLTLEQVPDALTAALAPYDENLDAPLYRKYEEGSPADHWWVNAMRKDREGYERMLRDGREETRARLIREFAAKATEWENETPQQKADKEIADYEWTAERDIGENPTWASVAWAYNEKWHWSESGTPAPVPGNVPDNEVNLDWLCIDEGGMAYTWSRYNPQSKWDYWRVGGRWSGYFQAKEIGPETLEPASHWDGPSTAALDKLACDGGRKRLLDFEAMRERAGVEADVAYSAYQGLVDRFGTAKPWRHFAELAQVQAITWDEAREQYRNQTLIRGHEALPDGERLIGFMGCLVEEFFLPRVEYVLSKRAAAVPAYGTLTLKGEWAAPGRMGWWGVSSDEAGDRDAYNIAMNAYLGELAEDTWLIVVDCHI